MKTFAFGVLAALLSVAVQAQVPHKINYQGYLTGAGGSAVDAPVSMTFTLYSVASGGSALYSETQTVTVSNGVFSAIIGNAQPLKLPFNVPYFLGITIARDAEMTPRQPVTASAYAIHAASAEKLIASATVASSQITGTLGTAQIADYAVTQAKLSSGAASAGQVLGTTGNTLQWKTPNAGTVTSVGTGPGLGGGPITGSGTIALATTQLLPVADCSANQIPKWNGSAWTCAADNDTNNTANDARYFKHGGNAFAAAAVFGTTDNQALNVQANGARVMRYEPNAISPNVIGGSPANVVTAGVRGATIGGGGVASGNTDPNFVGEAPNQVTDHYGTVGGGFGNRAGDASASLSNSVFATVGGGQSNTANGNHSTVAGGHFHTASGAYSTVAGGYANTVNRHYSTVAGGNFNTVSGDESTVAGGASNTASGYQSTVGGGASNTASGNQSTVGGGSANTASGLHSTIAGGHHNSAGGDYSFSAGRRSNANGRGSFSFADSNDFAFDTAIANSFRVRATGGVQFVTGIDDTGATTYSCVTSSGSAWSCSSDRNLKQNIAALDGKAVLDKLIKVPVYAWSPKGRNAHIRHYGPMAQDFHAAFELGESELMIGMQDADGVALAAIQGLHRVVTEKERRIGALEERVAATESERARLQSQLAALAERISALER